MFGIFFSLNLFEIKSSFYRPDNREDAPEYGAPLLLSVFYVMVCNIDMSPEGKKACRDSSDILS